MLKVTLAGFICVQPSFTAPPAATQEPSLPRAAGGAFKIIDKCATV
jgi:hypothetical protein